MSRGLEDDGDDDVDSARGCRILGCSDGGVLRSSRQRPMLSEDREQIVVVQMVVVW